MIDQPTTTTLSAPHERAFTVSVTAAYQKAKEKVESAKAGVEDAIDAIAECGALLESAKSTMRGRYHEWLTVQAQIHPDEAKRVLSVYHDRERQLNKRTLQNAGILTLANDSEPHKARTQDPNAWCRWVAKVRLALPDEMVGRMNDEQREAAREQLKPMVDLYEKLQ